MDFSRLPASWDSMPAGRASVRAGSNWLSRAKAAILQVPSVIVPEESGVHQPAASVSDRAASGDRSPVRLNPVVPGKVIAR